MRIKLFEGKKQDSFRADVWRNYVFRIASLVLGLLNTRLIIGYLGDSTYGLWITITSVVSWMQTGDLGIGNGLRNGLAKAYGENDKKTESIIIETAFSTLAKLSFVIFWGFIIVCEVLFATKILSGTLRVPMYITTVFFCVNLILGIAQAIVLAYQKSWLTSMAMCFSQTLSITSVLILSSAQIPSSLIIFAFVNGFCTIAPNILLIVILSYQGIKVISKIRLVDDAKVASGLYNTGLQFFLLQLCSLVLYSTDNLIINKLINSEMVARYGVISKVYDTGASIFSILLVALWSAVTYNIAQNNIGWIKTKIRQIQAIWIVYVLGVIVVSANLNLIVRIWLKSSSYVYATPIIVLFAAYNMLTAFSAIYVNILNGMGVIKLQIIFAVIASIINVPASIFFARNCNMGIMGVKFATFLCAILMAVPVIVQVKYELKRKSRL